MGIERCVSHPKFFTVDGKEIKYNDNYNDNVFGGFMNNNEYDWQTVFLKDDMHSEFSMRGEISIRVPKTDVKSLQEDITELREQNGLLLDQVEELEDKLRDSEENAFEWNSVWADQYIKNIELMTQIADLETQLSVIRKQRDTWKEKYETEIPRLFKRRSLPCHGSHIWT